MVAIVTGAGLGLKSSSGFVLGSRGTLGDASVGRLGSNVTVNAATGNLVIQNQDEILIGQGPDNILSRSYNSLGTLNDDNGDNWRESTQRLIKLASGTVNTAGSTVKRTEWDGSEVVFGWDAAKSAYVSKAGSGAYDTITFAADVYTWTDGETQAIEKYDNLKSGRLISVADTDGNQLTFTYITGNVTRVTTGSGDYTDLTWSGSNLVQLVSRSAAGTVLAARTRYAYDTSNRLTSVTTDLSPGDNAITDGNVATISYTYDGTSRRIATISDTGASNAIQFTYVLVGSNYRIETITEAMFSDNLRTTSFSYDTVNRDTTVTDALGKVAVLRYDANGNLIRVTYPPAQSGAVAQVVQYSYNSNGDVTSTTDAMGKVTSYAYDGNGNLTQERDGAGNTIDRTYGVKNELLTETRYLLPDVDEAGTLQAGNPVTKRYAYDSENHLRFVVDEDGQVTQYYYNTQGRPISTIKYTASAYSLTGIAANTSISEATLNSWASSITGTPDIQRTDFTYDFRGNLSTSIEYSDLHINRVRYSQFEQGTSGWTTWQSQSGMLQGAPTTGTDAGTGKKYIQQTFRGASTSDYVAIYTVDDGRLPVTPGERLAVRAGVGASAGVSSLVMRLQFFDVTGTYLGDSADIAWLGGAQNFNTLASGFVDVPATATQTRFIVYANAATLNTNITVTLTEPMFSQATLTQSSLPSFRPGIAAAINPIDLSSSASYSRTNYTYDQFGLLLSRQVLGKGYAENYTYDGLGRILTATDSTGATTTTVFNDGARTSTVTLANGMVKTSNFTAQGELWSYTESGSGVATQTENYKYDKLGRLRATFTAIGFRDFVFFDDAGRKVGEVDRKGAVTEYRYDAANRLIATIHYANQMSAADNNSLYDASGNPTTATIAGVRPGTNAAYDRWEWLVYDNADRVVQKIETIDGGWQNPYGKATTFEYDGAGRLARTTSYANRLSQTQIETFKSNLPGALNRIYNGQFDGIDGWGTGYNPNNIVNSGLPYVNVWAGKNYVKSLFTATAANQVSSISTDGSHWFPVTAGERLAVQAGVEGQGPISSQQLQIWYLDVNGNVIGGTSIGTVTGIQAYNSKISGFSTVPVGAVKARLELYCYTSAAGSGSYVIVEPTVTTATSAQTSYPSFSATPVLNASSDRVVRNFYSNDGLMVGTLDGDGAVIRYVYDKTGGLIDTVRNATLVSTGLRASGSWSQIVAELNASPNASDRHNYVVYDGEGQVRYTLDGNLRPTEYVYNTGGQVVRVVEYGAPIAAGNVTLSAVQGQISTLNLAVNPTNRTSRTVYDGAGRKTFDIDAQNGVTRYSYDNVGHVIKLERLIATHSPTDNPSISTMNSWYAVNTNPPDRISRFLYDALNRLVYEVDAAGFVTEHQYDLDDRVTKTIRYAAAYTVNDGATVASVKGQLPATMPADAASTSYAYDANGNVIDMWDGQGNRTHYNYTAFDQVWQMLEAYGTSDEASTNYLYDAAGRVLNEYTGVGTPEQTSTGYGYDAVGNLVSVVDPRGSTTTYSYDAVGNRLSQTVPLALDSSTFAVTNYQYDAFGNVVKVIDPRTNASYSYYDKLGQLIYQIDAEGYATQNWYTVGGALLATRHYYVKATNLGSTTVIPTIVTDTKDAVTTFYRDKLDRVTSVWDAENYNETYTLNAFGDRISVTNKLGGVTNNVFDKRGLLVQETLPVGSTRNDGSVQSANIINKFEYGARGNRTKMIEAFGLTEQRTTIYAYDKNDRLVSKTGDVQLVTHADVWQTWAAPVESYQYDARGNLILTAYAAGAKTFAYFDDNDRKIGEINAVGTLSRWTYDSNGNALTARIYGDAVALPGTAGGTPPSPVNGSNYRETQFTYDRANRLVTTTMTGLRFGWMDAPYTTVASGTVTTTNYYDAVGNIIRQVGGNTASVYTYYDKLGRKIGQIDQENYATGWSLDAEGNVLTETRYATRYAGTPTAGATMPAIGVDATNDRTTGFTYDRNGRRRSELRYNVIASNVSASGVLSTSSQTVTVSYTYNGLGEVTTKTEGSGDTTTNYYDVAGRLTAIRGPSYADYTTALVQPATDMYYDGLNNVTRTREGAGSGASVDDHVTTYSYYDGQGGRLASVVDAVHYSKSYYYDEAGRLTLTTYYRDFANNDTGQWEAASLDHDLLGRLTSQTTRRIDQNNTWVQDGDITTVAYNAYGEVRAKGINGVWPEVMDYDAGGRVWRSTAGDGVVKLFIYDGIGKPSLTITSSGAALPAGYSWSTLTIDQAVALLTNNGTALIGNVNVPGMVLTISAYDSRGALATTRELFRETTAIGSGQTTIVHSKSYNAFGEVVSETDARGNVTNFSYNTMGRLSQKLSPTVSTTAENGVKSNVRPQEDYYYDVSGRLVGIKDANNSLKVRTLLAGSGYGDDEALVLKEFHPDGGVVENRYDVFGNLKYEFDESGYLTTHYYDKMNQLVQTDNPTRADGVTFSDYFFYNSMGQVIRHSNSQLSWLNESTDYDIQGRVIQQFGFGGDQTTYSYSWNSGIATTGLGTFGGWTKSSRIAGQTNALTEVTDYFGRTVDKNDYGNHNYDYSFDLAGRLTQRTNSLGQAISYSYYNTGLMASQASNYGTTYYGSTITSAYKYDADGNRTFESYSANTTYTDWYYGGTYSYNTVHQSASVTWDALNRMTSFVDTGASGSAPTSIAYEFDKVGNIRHMFATFRYMDAQGVVATSDSTQDYWYRYDNMNRFVTTRGMLSGTNSGGTVVTGEAARGLADATIKRGTSVSGAQIGGLDIAYDQAGKRKSVTRTILQVGGVFPNISIIYKEQREDYSYTADGYLADIRIATGTATSSPTTPPPAAPATGVLQGTYTRDALGRVSNYTEYQANGTSVAYSRASSYNVKSQVTSDITTSVRSDGTWVNSTTYYYDSSGNGYGTYLGGVVTKAVTTVTKNGAAQTGNSTTNTYEWWDSALQKTTQFVSGATTNNSTFYYDEGGHLQSVYIQDGRPRTVSFITDANGQVLQRDESDNNSAAGDPRELHYYFNGLKVGDVSNNGTSDVDYAAGITQHTATPSTGAFRNGSTSSVNYADFDQSYDPINGLTYENTASRYTVQAGDTLESIAQALWGDASFWYMIADANGIHDSDSLVAGQSIVVPNKVHNSHNNTSTWKVYDPNEAIGDTAPTAAKPPAKKQGCGTFGTILLVAIAVAVTVVTAGAAAAAASPTIGGISAGIGAIAAGTTGLSAGALIGIGAAAGALGSIASQGFGVATGLQDRFSWKGVALSALAGGIGGGVGASGLLKGATPFVTGAARGVAGSIVTQGLAVATGLQNKFDWAGVAAAGLGGGIGNWAGSSLNLSGVGGRIVSDMAGGIAASAAQSLVSGKDFGDTLVANLPSIIGNTIGNLVAGSIAQSGQERAFRRAGVERSAATFRNQFGDTAEVAAYEEAGLYAANHPGSSEGRANLDQAARILLQANGSDPEVAAFLNHVDPNGSAAQLGDITVTGNRDYLFGSTIDNAGIWVGERGSEIAQGVGRFVQNHPGIGIALTLADGAFAVVAPVKYLGGMALDYFKDEATGFIADKMTGPQLWSVEKGQAGGGGFVLAGGIALGGLGALRGAASGGAADLPSGSFSISDWSGYPSGVPRPQGPFRLVGGAEYNGARNAANKANATIRREQGLVGQPVDVHEIQPVKFGGSATDPANKAILSRDLHRQQVTPWWNQLQKDLGR